MSAYTGGAFPQSAPGLFRENVEYSLRNICKDDISSSDFMLQHKIENGTECVIKDAPQIQYIWMDGKPVVKTDEAMLAIARGGHKFMPGPDNPRFWMVIISVILILIGGGSLAYKHFTSKD